MRKITFLLTLLLMYIGVTPMMADVDVTKKYAIRYIHIDGTSYYLIANTNSNSITLTNTSPADFSDEYCFVFVDTGKELDGNKLYKIKTLANNFYTYKPSQSYLYIKEANDNDNNWIVEDTGDGGVYIYWVQYNDGNYSKTTFTWYPIPTQIGRALTLNNSGKRALELIEVGDYGESGGNEGGGNEGGGNEGGDNEGESTIDYTPNFTGEKTRTTRLLTSFAVNNDTYNLTNQEQLQSYVDKTSTKTFTVEAESTVVLNMGQGGKDSGWMNAYVYIDADKDGFEAGINGNWQPTSDLVSYSFYSNSSYSDVSGYNSAGSSISGNSRSTLYLPPFTAPSIPGVYRIRAKYDWCNIDPNGGQGTYFGGTFTSHGGAIVDFTLVVTAKKEPINLTLAEITADDHLLYGLKGYIGSFSAPYDTEIPTTGVEAYYATSNDNMGYITLTPCVATGTSAKGVPANFGVILVSQNQNITLNPASGNIDTPAKNVFGNSASEAVVMGDNCYVLANGDDGIGFYLATKGTTLKAGKAYIQLPNSSQTSALRLVLDETVTGINGVATEKADAPIYDLSGRRVLNTVKGGIYIQNGKKFIVK